MYITHVEKVDCWILTGSMYYSNSTSNHHCDRWGGNVQSPREMGRGDWESRPVVTGIASPLTSCLHGNEPLQKSTRSVFLWHHGQSMVLQAQCGILTWFLAQETWNSKKWGGNSLARFQMRWDPWMRQNPMTFLEIFESYQPFWQAFLDKRSLASLGSLEKPKRTKAARSCRPSNLADRLDDDDHGWSRIMIHMCGTNIGYL